MKNDNTKTFETSDFFLAVFLVAKGINLLGFRPTLIQKRKLFVFQPTDDLHNLIQNFWAKKELIEPLHLFQSERELKNRLYSDSYNNEFTKKEYE